MSEAASGSVVETPAGNPPPQTPPADNGSAAGGGQTWLDGLSEGNRQLAKNKGWTAPEHLDKALTSYGELEQRIGQAVSVPKSDAAPEEWNKFYSRVGRPESPDKYEFKRPENLPADVAYSDDLAKASKAWMHGAGLNPQQAQSVHDGFVGFMAEQQAAVVERTKAKVQSTHDTLVKDWGGPTDSEAFKGKLAMANRALNKLGLKEAYQGAGILLPDGSLTDPQIAKALAEIGEAMFKEDTIDADGGGVPGGDNPFKRDAEGKIKSPGAISDLIKSDPERAKRLCREAGEPIDRWFTSNPR